QQTPSPPRHRRRAIRCASIFSPQPPPPPGSTLFPYTTLFRSRRHRSPAHGTIAGGTKALHHARHPGTYPPAGRSALVPPAIVPRSEEHTSELQSRGHLVCRLLLEKKKTTLKPLLILYFPGRPT